jgi:hypothetical protein
MCRPPRRRSGCGVADGLPVRTFDSLVPRQGAASWDTGGAVDFGSAARFGGPVAIAWKGGEDHATAEGVVGVDRSGLLVSASVGRIGYTEGSVPVIRLVNFSVREGTIVVWTVPGGCGASVAGQTVAFEVDQVDPRSRSGWSVLAAGTAEAVTDVEELVAATDFPRRPWVAERNDQVNRIRVDRISGLQLPPLPAIP